MDHKELYNLLIQKMNLYHPTKEYSMVLKAYELALEAHGDQLRKSGEPYIIHPLQVAIILADLKLDRESIVAGILHDVIEDTKYTYDDISEMFSNEVANIVEGLTKLEKYHYNSKEEFQAENYRKMLMSMSKDIRVIIIKIADRLHNMRTLNFMTTAKQMEIAQETLDIYAPMADRLGICKIKSELEDLSFKYLKPEEYKKLATLISKKQEDRQDFIDDICTKIKAILAENDMIGEVTGRPKHFFSIYKKMINHNKELDQIYDLFAVRIILKEKSNCYIVLGLLHDVFASISSRFKDYISGPKQNNYRSLHTGLIAPNGEPFEVQIRTYEMHSVAEYGVAAHWRYKQKQDGKNIIENQDTKLTWLARILECIKDQNSTDFLHLLKNDLNIYDNEIRCFTPKGEIKTLPKGSNPIDFAYLIHSDIGNKITGAIVNEKRVPINYILQDGDRVEVVTSKASRGPSRDWLMLVKTSQARSKINNFFKKENKEDYILQGKNLLEKEVKRRGVTLNQLFADKRGSELLKRYSFNDLDTLFSSVGQGYIKETHIVNKLFDEYKNSKEKQITDEQINEIIDQKIEQLFVDTNTNKRKRNKSGIVIKALGDVVEASISKCCTPLPGDKIVAFMRRGKSLSIHRADCPNIKNLKEEDKNRVLEATWDIPEKGLDVETFYSSELLIVGSDNVNPNLLMEILNFLTTEQIKATSFNAKTVKNLVNLEVNISIKSKEQLKRITNKILKIKGIVYVDRTIV